MWKRGYPPEFRRRVLDLVEAGRKVAEVAEDLGISDQTIYNWRRQDRVDRGLEPGLTTAEQAELVAARKRIRALEAELAVHRRATELHLALLVAQHDLSRRSSPSLHHRRLQGALEGPRSGLRHSTRRAGTSMRGGPGRRRDQWADLRSVRRPSRCRGTASWLVRELELPEPADRHEQAERKQHSVRRGVARLAEADV